VLAQKQKRSLASHDLLLGFTVANSKFLKSIL